MQHTYQLNTSNLNSTFIESVKSLFGSREVEIVVKDVETSRQPDQKELFRQTELLRIKLRSVEVDPNINLSDLASEVNL